MKPNKKKIVITGTGLLASNIASYKSEDWSITLLTRNSPLHLSNVENIKADLSSEASLKNILLSIKPDVVIHTAGLANVEECETNYDNAYLSNVIITRNIITASRSCDSKLVHISTDHFANQSLDYSTEKDIDLPLNNYAKTKLTADLEVIRDCPNSLVIRTNFFGWGNLKRKSFSDFIIENLRAGKEITLFDDVYYTPIFIDELTDSIEELVKRDMSGVYNIVSNKKISKYEFGIALAQVFGLDLKLIKKGSINNHPMTQRPHNMALSNMKLVNDLGEKFNFDFINSLKRLKQSDSKIHLVNI